MVGVGWMIGVDFLVADRLEYFAHYLWLWPLGVAVPSASRGGGG